MLCEACGNAELTDCAIPASKKLGLRRGAPAVKKREVVVVLVVVVVLRGEEKCERDTSLCLLVWVFRGGGADADDARSRNADGGRRNDFVARGGRGGDLLAGAVREPAPLRRVTGSPARCV